MASESFESAIRRFDAENAMDPNIERVAGVERPRELLYAERLTAWVLRLQPDASEALRLAARCQHLCRWMIPRDSYPMTRTGYLKWRENLRHFHAEKAGQILGETGFSEEIVHRVQALNLKRGFPDDPESRVIEDALCLVFLEFQFTDLAQKTTEEKLINAVRKSWLKMTPRAREEALKLPLGPVEKALIEKALKDAGI